MKVILINKHGIAWEFKTTRDARKYIKKDASYHLCKPDGRKIKIYCDYAPSCWECNRKNCKYKEV